ncbi:energy-coupling factor transporter transmembrane component T [Quadrisphaera sp. DSM 44207]|uniref:energy-coupling factor transporter transmembrane component T n=1 Tax=Quadrisphaera sp. DSM 44207 TaxID=1881057 RepID=UPI000882EFC4|nr:energy-coupling factor transporter transmembrane component T [Quadrisphaera sp. DSM 44207]SDQ48275.1 biotin transport system permease protein [Quadrisphaera sp. DSM 44207]
MIGLYREGSSPLHRAPAWAKLALLALGTTLLVAVATPAAVGVGALVVVSLVALARVPAAVALAQVWPLRWITALLVPFQWWAGEWRAVVVVVGTLLLAVLAAALVTLTTRVGDVLDVLVALLRPARRLGVDPERVALVLALTIRSVPLLLAAFDEARDARRARGLERSPRALVVPLVIRSVRHAHLLGEALTARGVDD